MPEPVTMAAVGSAAPLAAGGSAPSWAGPLIGAAGSVLGGLISNSMNEEIAAKQLDFQREAMRHGIAWRVQDAKEAGLHPLFALGANLPTPTPIAFGDQLGPSIAEAGQSIGNAVARSESVHERAVKGMELALLDAQWKKTVEETNWIREQADASLANRTAQTAQTGLGIQPETPPNGQVPNPPGVGMIDLEPAKVPSHQRGNPHVTAGTKPAYEERYLAPNFPIMLPESGGESPEEIISEMNPWTWAALIRRNSQIYGDGWLSDLLDMRYFGANIKIPPGKYKSTKERR